MFSFFSDFLEMFFIIIVDKTANFKLSDAMHNKLLSCFVSLQLENLKTNLTPPPKKKRCTILNYKFINQVFMQMFNEKKLLNHYMYVV